ncbi:UbiA prenyltransferase family-domain-containing protein [Geopyxis carbonaria]|nr:UbiA prenyltransferase family-domain-containing protein [Geopyxis carbonaria]
MIPATTTMLLLRRIPRLPSLLSPLRRIHTLPRSRSPILPHNASSRALTPHLRPSSLILRAHASTTLSSETSKSIQESTTNPTPAHPTVYAPPTTGFLSLLPAPIVPYAELVRLQAPTGTLYLLLPCLWSTLLAATLTAPVTPLPAVLGTCALFTTGAFIMRGAGCTINDLWDRRIDPLVSRTRLRPLARGAISVPAAVAFTGAQLLAGLALLVQFPVPVIWAAIPSLAVVAAYPGMKRVTHYPQAVLGLAFSWGALLGFPALGLSLLDPTVATVAALLYGSNVAWTVLYDTVYAHQDIKDDKKAGVKSTAVRHEHDTKRFLAALGVVQVGLLAGAGVVAGAGPVFFVGSCGGAAAGLAWMIWRVRLGVVRECGEWFRWCAWAVGGVAVGGGLIGEYAWKRITEETVEGEVKSQI